jgi:hypothetical protein
MVPLHQPLYIILSFRGVFDLILVSQASKR